MFSGTGSPFHRSAAVIENPFASGGYTELGDFVDGIYEVETENDDTIIMSRAGHVDGAPAQVSKLIKMNGEAGLMDVEYRITAGEKGLSCLFAVENVFSFLAGDAPDRYFDIPGREIAGGRNLASRGAEEGVETLRMVDEWLGLTLTMEFRPGMTVWRYPVETVSNSDSGFERVYQGSAVVAVRKLDLGPGEAETFRMTISVENLN